MFKIIKPLATLTLLAAGGVAFAQDVNMGTPAGEAASTEPQIGDVYEKETSGDWSLRCMVTEDGNDPCQIHQILKDGEGRSIAEVNMFPMPEGHEAAAAATVVVPLMTLLPEGITITVDENEPRRYPVEFCGPNGCLTRLGFTAEELDAFKSGSKATVRIVQAETQENAEKILTLSLTGFTAGFDKATPPPAQ